MAAALAPLHDIETATCVAAERGVMSALEGDCKTPLAAYARRIGDEMELAAFIAEPDGSKMRRARERIAWPSSERDAERFGLDIGQRLK